MMRHENIVLVVLSYIIGFTTAYIAFGIAPDITHQAAYTPGHANEPEFSTDKNDAHDDSPIDIFITEDGMFADVAGSERVISGKLRDGVTTGPGFHVSIPRYEPSPEGEYVYYCEQQSSSENVCHEYLYLVQEHLIKPLKAQGEALTSSVSDSGFRWMREGVLASPQFISETPDTPWKLVPAN